MTSETQGYGWLSPSGEFYQVSWGDHDSWAQDHIKELLDWESLSLKERISAAGMGDVLMNHGWILLHNPSHGTPFPTRKPGKRYTRAQAEFLYDYFIQYGDRRQANAVMED